MKRIVKPLVLALALLILVPSCKKIEHLRISQNELVFSIGADWQTFILNADCDWSIKMDDDVDWCSVSPMSGGAVKDGIIMVKVDECQESRSTSFTVSSASGKIQAKVVVTQELVEFESIINTVFGVRKEEQWNTDFYGNIIEDSYKFAEFNPNDTTTGFMMYFLEDNVGVQVDKFHDSTMYYMFDYEYNLAERRLDISFETVSGETESYSVTVTLATFEHFRFEQEYKPNFWERSDMKKIGTIQPSKRSSILQKTVKKRKGEGLLFGI